MIVKRLKKLWKLTVLIGIRQSYQLLRNWYLLWREPYQTLKEIKEEGDKSQMFLVSLTSLSPFWLYMLMRLVWDLSQHGRLLVVTGKVFEVMGVIQLILLGYLGYWSYKVLKEKE